MKYEIFEYIFIGFIDNLYPAMNSASTTVSFTQSEVTFNENAGIVKVPLTIEGERNGRYFTDFTEKTFDGFLSGIRHVKIEEQWLTGDVRPGRESEQWLNLILRKV